MTLQEIMTTQTVGIAPEESVQVAARTMTRHNIGMLPVLDKDRKLQGVITDRDIVTRCLALDKSPASTPVSQIMTRRLVTGTGEMDTSQAAQLMGREQIRRLPVVAGDRLQGMVSLADLACRQEESAGQALAKISQGVSSR